MAKLPTVSGKEVISAFQKRGFAVKRQKGSHVTLYKNKDGKNLYVTVPLHSNRELFPSVLLSIIRQAGMTRDEFIVMMQK
mgnify:CR=1 FL=1